MPIATPRNEAERPFTHSSRLLTPSSCRRDQDWPRISSQEVLRSSYISAVIATRWARAHSRALYRQLCTEAGFSGDSNKWRSTLSESMRPYRLRTTSARPSASAARRHGAASRLPGS